MTKAIFVLAASLLSLAPAAVAADEVAWDKFRDSVASACTHAAQATLGETVASVDPYGTDSYGLAIVRSVPSPDLAMICVYNKTTGVVELGAQMQSAASPAAARKSAMAPTSN